MALTSINTEYDGFLNIGFKGRKLFEIPDEVLTDGDGNEYTTVVIGSQEWSVENLRSTSYMDGTAIPTASSWSNSLATYCWYNNTTDETLRQKYGALYSWQVVNPDNPKQIAPEGWRVPTDADWTALEDYLIANGFNWDGTTEGNKIGKALASSGGEWDPHGTVGNIGNDQGSNNSSGFNVLPGGYRLTNGIFTGQGGRAAFWSSTTNPDDPGKAFLRILYSFFSTVGKTFDMYRAGYSVRLVRDI